MAMISRADAIRLFESVSDYLRLNNENRWWVSLAFDPRKQMYAVVLYDIRRASLPMPFMSFDHSRELERFIERRVAEKEALEKQKRDPK